MMTIIIIMIIIIMIMIMITFVPRTIPASPRP